MRPRERLSGPRRWLALVLLLSGACGAGSSPLAAGRDAPPATPSTSDAADTALDRHEAGPTLADAAEPTSDAPPIPADAPAAFDAAPVTGAHTVVVMAGTVARQNAIVSFTLPGSTPGYYTLVDASGAKLPLQADDAGHATFVLPMLAAGAQASYTLGPGIPPTTATAAREDDGVVLSLGAAHVMRFQTKGKLPAGIGQAYLRGGYIHPLYTPSGLLVTDDYPPDHRHHHGIWSAWAHSSFEGRQMDFWNMGGGSAKVDFDTLDATWDGTVYTGFRSHQIFVDLKAPGGGKTALREQWTVTLYAIAGAPYYVFDLDSTQEAASTSTVMLEQYLYGGFAFRGSAQWRGGATFLTSEGKNRLSGDGSTGRWVHMSGLVDGKTAGYAVLGHPSNFRAPQPMRLNPDDPYFSFSPVKPSGFPIEPGKPYGSRFRFVVSDGPADAALLDRIWNDYATPATVTVN